MFREIFHLRLPLTACLLTLAASAWADNPRESATTAPGYSHPNILTLPLDDLGWMDPSFNGGRIAVGNEIPVMDELTHEGLTLKSDSSRPSRSSTRATIHTDQNPVPLILNPGCSPTSSLVSVQFGATGPRPRGSHTECSRWRR